MVERSEHRRAMLLCQGFGDKGLAPGEDCRGWACYQHAFPAHARTQPFPLPALSIWAGSSRQSSLWARAALQITRLPICLYHLQLPLTLPSPLPPLCMWAGSSRQSSFSGYGGFADKQGAKYLVTLNPKAHLELQVGLWGPGSAVLILRLCRQEVRGFGLADGAGYW